MEKPIIIVGAGRSGTKMLRSILNCSDEVISFPREINYIWRHGNIGYPTDELTPSHARPEVIDYIRNRFNQLNVRNGYRRVVEKTCANSLRVEFVHAVFPDAYIIHLVRDGRSVAESARRRWLAKPELGYLLEKARWVPMTDIPFYGLRFLRFQLGRIKSQSGSQSSWGPRFAQLDGLIQEKSLIEVCGIQWQTCVQSASKACAQLPGEQVFTVRYEDLVQEPVKVSKQIFEHVGLSFLPACEQYVRKNIHPGNLDKWRQNLTPEEQDLLSQTIEAGLMQYGYRIQSS